MRGKQPKERDHYMLRMADGTLVDVSREVYLEWYRSRRRERYQKERNPKQGICSLDSLDGRVQGISGMWQKDWRKRFCGISAGIK